MKTTKRILSIALALALGLALLIPAGAAVRIEENKTPLSKVTVFTGDTLKLEIDVKVFDGATELAVEYVWYDYAYNGVTEQAPPIATGAKLEIPITPKMTPMGVELKTYRVAVIAGGEPVGFYDTDVHMYISVRHLPELFWNLILDIAGGNTTIAGITMAIMFPVTLVGFIFLTPLLLLLRLTSLF